MHLKKVKNCQSLALCAQGSFLSLTDRPPECNELKENKGMQEEATDLRFCSKDNNKRGEGWKAEKWTEKTQKKVALKKVQHGEVTEKICCFFSQWKVTSSDEWLHNCNFHPYEVHKICNQQENRDRQCTRWIWALIKQHRNDQRCCQRYQEAIFWEIIKPSSNC